MISRILTLLFAACLSCSGQIYLSSYPYYRMTNPTTNVLDNCDSAANWSVNHGTVALDTTLFHGGTGSVRVIGDPNYDSIITCNNPDTYSGAFNYLSFWLYAAPTNTTLLKMLIYVYSGSSYISYNRYYPVLGAWNEYRFPMRSKQQSVVGGAAYPMTITKIVIDIYDTSNTKFNGAVWFDDVTFCSGAISKGVICFDWEGAYPSIVSNALPILNTYGWKATCLFSHDGLSVSDGADGTTLDAAGLAPLHTAGWSMGSHTYDSSMDFSTATAEQVRTNWVGMQDWLTAQGWTECLTVGTWPGHCYNSTVKAGAIAAGMQMVLSPAAYGSAYPISHGQSGGEILACDMISMDTSTSPTTIAAQIANAAIGGDLLIIVGHRCSNTSVQALNYTSLQLSNVCDVVRQYENCGLVKVMTLADYLQYLNSYNWRTAYQPSGDEMAMREWLEIGRWYQVEYRPASLDFWQMVGGRYLRQEDAGIYEACLAQDYRDRLFRVVQFDVTRTPFGNN